MEVAEPLVAVRRGQSFFADCLVSSWPAAARVLEAEATQWGCRMGQAVRSPGSSAAALRLRVEIGAPPDHLTGIELALLLRRLRSMPALDGVLLADRGIFSDGGALLVELTKPLALPLVAPLCEEMALVTSTLATIRTSSSPEVWRTLLDRFLNEDADCAVLRLRWRPSRMGGRPWVTPTATPQQLAAHRRLCGRPAAVQQWD